MAINRLFLLKETRGSKDREGMVRQAHKWSWAALVAAQALGGPIQEMIICRTRACRPIGVCGTSPQQLWFAEMGRLCVFVGSECLREMVDVVIADVGR